MTRTVTFINSIVPRSCISAEHERLDSIILQPGASRPLLPVSFDQDVITCAVKLTRETLVGLILADKVRRRIFATKQLNCTAQNSGG